jgi:hypothetical protein
VYVVTTPATVLQPFAFYDKLHSISSYYAKSHGGYTVTSTWHHWRVVLTYFAVSYFSPFRAIAVAMFAAVVLGAVAWARDDRRLAAVILCFPLAFLAFFCGSYRVCIIRNYLLIAPFLSVLAARGVAELFRWIAPRWGRLALAGVLAAAGLVQAIWLVHAAETIRTAEPNRDVREALAYVAAHTATHYRLSDRVKKLAAAQHLALPGNATESRDAEQVVFFVESDGPAPPRWHTNDPWQFEAVFGPREVSMDWYSSWTGSDRVAVMTTEKARATGVPFVIH